MKAFFKKINALMTREPAPIKDRSGGLIIFGTLDILFGIACFALAMLLLIVTSSTGLHGMKPIHYWMMMTMLFFLTGWFIVMGLGSIKARRWARALLLIGAWVSVFFSTMALALILYILPEIYNILADSCLVSPTVALVCLYLSISILAVVQIIFPLIAISFHGSESVKATCERLNPQPIWIDRYPLPLLALSFIALLGGLSIVTSSTTNYVVFLFGNIQSGVLGAMVVAVISLACGYVGWGALTRKMHAWWGAYAIVLLISSSMLLTFSELDMETLYTHMGYSAEQIKKLENIYPFSPATLTFISGAWGIMACIHLVWVRDCFRTEKKADTVKSHQQRKAEKKAEEEAHLKSTKPRNRMRLE